MLSQVFIEEKKTMQILTYLTPPVIKDQNLKTFNFPMILSSSSSIL